MKKILLIGDSIRVGYDSSVKEALGQVAEVYYPAENCRFAQYILRTMKMWKEALALGDDIDCIHWNCGLWDTLELFEDGPLTPLPFYESFIERICRQIPYLYPNAKCIFATSTPVLEHRFPNPKAAIRHNSITQQYNKAAIRIVKSYGHEINDLYGLMDGVPEDFYSDMTHFYTVEGTKRISLQVIESIANCLNLPKDKINYDYMLKADIKVVGQ